MSRTKNPTLRKRTRELSECAEDARECQLLGYELKDLGSLLVKMAIHMEDLQRKVDSQAEYIKTLNEDRKTEPQTWTKENCKGCKYNEYPYDSGTCFVRVCINGNKYEPKTENCSEIPNNCMVKNYCDDCLYTDTCDSKEFFYACTSKATREPKTEPQTERSE